LGGEAIDHVIRHLPRDIETFREMPNGAEYPAAHATAMGIWKRRIAVEEFLAGRSLSTREREGTQEGNRAALSTRIVSKPLVEAEEGLSLTDPDGPYRQGHLQPHPLRLASGACDQT
jgi:hypothetical protein